MKLIKKDLGKFLLALFLSGGFATLASADGKGLMLGGGVYYVSEVFDDSSTAYNLDVGWRFNKWIAVDAGYWDLGEFDNTEGVNIKTNTDAWTLGVLASIPIWIIDIYGRAGASFWEANNKGIDNDDGTDPYYGVGLAFNIGASLDIYGEWVRFALDNDYDLFGVGVRWTF